MSMWRKCCCLCARETYEPPDVQELDYRHSSLSEVPPEIFTYERTLERLFLGSNQITDLPPNLFYCHELRELDLCDNELKELPAAVESLNRLAKLNLCRNALHEVPESIKNCKSLTYLDLSLNQFSKIPEAICQLVHLEELFLNETALDFLPANFGRLTKLKNLELRDNTIVSLPMSMNRLNVLQRLDIGCNEMEELPTVIGSMTNLMELWADDNAMRQDCNSKVLGNLPKLTCLDLSKNSITSISDQVGKCVSLTDITLSFNDLSEMPSSFTKLENATTVRIDNNRLNRLPEDLGKLKNLQELNLSCNLLKSIPLSIGLLRKLHTLYLDDNRLTELPKEIGSCTSLTVLSVANNNIKEIPSEIGHLSNLKVLVLTNNSIRNLPVSILGLTNLGALWLTEGQNKPLVALNREIDSSTGQHVVTCCLLPQLSASETITNRSETEEALPRRSGRKIRFETDIEPPAPEKPVVNGGLLRAPTPYPKELRAMAKHASHIRQTRNQNGEAINISDEPVYEGDYNEDSMDYQAKRNYGSRSVTGTNENLSIKMEKYREMGTQEEVIALVTQKPKNQSNSTTPNVRKNESPPLIPDHSSRMTGDTSRDFSDFTYQPVSQDDDVVAPPTTAVSSFNMGRTPPPYHIAAQRAAFLRSSGGAGTGKINFPSELKNSNSNDVGANQDTPPISPDQLGSNTTFPYEPMSTSVSQSSSNSTMVTSSSINEISKESYNPVNINAPLVKSKVRFDNMGNIIDTIPGGLNEFTNAIDPTINVGYGGFQADRNSNLTLNKAYPLADSTDSNATIYANQDPSNEEKMPPAMQLLVDAKQQPAKQISESHIPHNKNMNHKTPESKICRIPSLQSSNRRPYSAGQVGTTTTPTPTRIPSVNPEPSPILNHRSKHASGSESPHSRPRSNIPDRKQNAPNKTASTSRIPGTMFSETKLPMSSAKKSAVSPATSRYASSSGIPKFSSGQVSNSNDEQKSYSRIPKFEPSRAGVEDINLARSSSSTDDENRSAHQWGASEKASSRGISPKLSRSGFGRESDHSDSKIPTTRKPWIFGSHRNARVVSLEYRKANKYKMGFSIMEYPGQSSHPEGKGVYISSTDSEDLPIKVGDKILQVDGIDVGNMGVDIVLKILGNCQENIQLLVSRQK